METSPIYECWWDADTWHESEGEYEGDFLLRMDTVSGYVESEIFDLHSFFSLIRDGTIHEIEGICEYRCEYSSSYGSRHDIESTVLILLLLIERRTSREDP